MSWRLLFFTLLVLAGVATVGGLYTGDWLIEHAPKQANLPDFDKHELSQKVGADGKPILNQPPQPLMNGKLGIPEPLGHVDWRVKAENLSNLKSASSASISETNPSIFSEDASTHITTNISIAESSSQTIKTRPINSTHTSQPSLGSASWEPAFHNELASCRQLGFGERADCVRNVRNHYCGGNNAWGQVSDCPMR